MAEALTPREAARLIAVAGGGFTDTRDRAYLAILYRCGLRNNECRMLDIHDIRRDQQPWTVRVRYPKGLLAGVQPRELGVDSDTKKILARWLELRGNKAGPLFQTRNGNRIHTSHFRRKVTNLGNKAGIDRRVHPHALRHTFARALNDEGVSVRLIQLALGHRNLNTTATYLQGLGDPEVIAMTSRRSWG